MAGIILGSAIVFFYKAADVGTVAEDVIRICSWSDDGSIGVVVALAFDRDVRRDGEMGDAARCHRLPLRHRFPADGRYDNASPTLRNLRT